jgi:hypothetical protein
VLATILETDRTDVSATEHAAESAAEAVSARTAAERLGAVAEVVVAVRTTMWLDELTATGELTFAQRRRLAAEDGTGKLAPLLRRLELAGHDPRAALAAAVRGEAQPGRGLDNVRQVSNVLVHRLTQNQDLEPTGDRFATWAPATDDPALAAQLAQITAAGDARRHELGTDLAANPPLWAAELLGPVPDQADDPDGRARWIERAGTIAAHREITGLTDEPTDPAELLGPAPKPGQVEAYASWRAAWRATGEPDIDRDERQMSVGQLRVRVRAWEREKTWAPRRVTNELAGTIQAAEHHRATAQLRTAEARAATDPGERDRLNQEAREATALANTLEADVPRLRQLDAQYLTWWGHTAGTRANHDTALAELDVRGESVTDDDHLFTAAELLDADRAAREADDDHRDITEHDLAHGEHDESPDDRAEEDRALPDHADQDDTAEPRSSREPVGCDEADAAKQLVAPRELLDLREIAAHEPDPVDEDTVRVTSAEAMSDSTRRAVRAIGEIRARNAADAEREAADDQAQVSRVIHWRTRDQHEAAQVDPDEAGDYAAEHA